MSFGGMSMLVWLPGEPITNVPTPSALAAVTAATMGSGGTELTSGPHPAVWDGAPSVTRTMNLLPGPVYASRFWIPAVYASSVGVPSLSGVVSIAVARVVRWVEPAGPSTAMGYAVVASTQAPPPGPPMPLSFDGKNCMPTKTSSPSASSDALNAGWVISHFDCVVVSSGAMSTPFTSWPIELLTSTTNSSTGGMGSTVAMSPSHCEPSMSATCSADNSM